MSASLVVDASFAFKLLLPGPERSLCQGLMARWQEGSYNLCAPALWLYEITSALCKVVHFGAITAEEGQQALALAQGLGVRLSLPDEAQARLAFEWTLRLKRAAAYDSFYLALAQQLDCDLWTADKRLRDAVDLPWVHGIWE